MIHNRNDYNRIQDPDNKIGENEPVFLLRGKDVFAPATIKKWAVLMAASGDMVTAESVRDFAEQMEQWQKINGCKVPDVPKEELLGSD